jgi:hypothetical protein
MEMKQWWEQTSHVAMGDYERSEVEDFTGCIPLLLDTCVVGEKIDLIVADLRNIYDKAVSFVQQVRRHPNGDEGGWKWYDLKYSTLLQAALSMVYTAKDDGEAIWVAGH